MTGCRRCDSTEIYVENAAEWLPSAPQEALCRVCFLGVGK